MIARRNLVAALAASVMGLAGTAVASVTHGGDGVRSALLGLVLVLVFMSAGSIPFVAAGDTQHGRGSFAFIVLALTYALRLVLALVVLKLSARSEWVEGSVVGLTAIACTVAWTMAHVVLGLSRKHAPTLDV